MLPRRKIELPVRKFAPKLVKLDPKVLTESERDKSHEALDNQEDVPPPSIAENNISNLNPETFKESNITPISTSNPSSTSTPLTKTALNRPSLSHPKKFTPSFKPTARTGIIPTKSTSILPSSDQNNTIHESVTNQIASFETVTNETVTPQEQSLNAPSPLEDNNPTVASPLSLSLSHTHTQSHNINACKQDKEKEKKRSKERENRREREKERAKKRRKGVLKKKAINKVNQFLLSMGVKREREEGGRERERDFASLAVKKRRDVKPLSWRRYTVYVQNTAEGLGLSVREVGGWTVVVAVKTRDKAAEKSESGERGRVMPGDVVLGVNSLDATYASFDRVLQALRSRPAVQPYYLANSEFSVCLDSVLDPVDYRKQKEMSVNQVVCLQLARPPNSLSLSPSSSLPSSVDISSSPPLPSSSLSN
mmetsp:Transcript_13874/g.13954  ORF Transcript_13874/g.13954 Transcript_13874/m.13954 type:complete len:423 (+) Transcript_13874:151-1419(+)|eukprot:CAMPEP_0182421346 /NCGR_PEP_ID=MMETSP1167-20130531/6697_1 /TAXON_ID=2988 /ORGANISM="Mallomonas Sp, Strain CCMP3275" /LENGTH=422 /DNA_ID=CAMNT_0024598389 /DNA_START=33 /DNA_END=1301 /DNA_ORIENTATION=-